MSSQPAKSPAPLGAFGEEPFRRLVEGITDYAIFLLDAEGHIASWNRGAQLLKGYSRDEVIGKHFSIFYEPEDIARKWPAHELTSAAAQGRFEDEGWRVRKDGSRFWANVVITAMHDEAGKLTGYSRITRDLTERRAAETRLRLSEEGLRLLIEGVEDYAIFQLDPIGTVLTWNAGAERIKGYRPEEIIGRHFSIFYPPEALARNWPARELEEAARVGHFEDEGWRVRKDGARIWANVVITALRDSQGLLRGFSKITRDLTKRREQEEALRRSEERFRLLLEGVRDYAIMMLDQEGRVTSWNAGAERILGYSADEVLGRSFQRFFPPEDVAGGQPAEELRKAILNSRFEQHGWRVRKGGARFWAEVIVIPLHDADGQLHGFAKVTRDLSERKRIESLEEQGRHLTEFLAMLAHELRNPLAPIRNALAIMGMSRELPKQVTWSREVIERQTTQLARLVDDLLDVSRITRGKLRLREAPMDLNATVARAVEAAQPLIDTRKHRLHTTMAAEEITVYGDAARLTQVVLNLLNNAAKYTPEGGDIWLDVRATDGSAEVRVRDNGVGIPATLIDGIFDLFAQGERTIDRSEGGLGIGLTLARRLVALHGGHIAAASAGVGKGAEFVVTLPRMGRDAPAGGLPEDGFVMPVGMKKLAVLVVDDNVDAALSMAMLLRLGGHQADIEHSGPPALARAIETRPDVLLLDIGLPGMSGYEVARELRKRPELAGLRIFAMTGYGQDEDRKRSLEAGFDGHLVKPVLPAEIFALISEPATRHQAG